MATYIDLDNDNIYKDIIVEINNKYWLESIKSNKEIFIKDEDFIVYWDKFNCFKQLKIIDIKTNRLNNVRFLLLRDYINRKTNVGWLDWYMIIDLIEELKKQNINNKWLLNIIEKKWFKKPIIENRFYSFGNLDIWNTIIYNWKTLYNELVKIIKNRKNKSDLRLVKLDKRKLKKWVKAKDLMFSLEWLTLNVYFKKDNSKYLDLYLSELDLLTKFGKPRKIVFFLRDIIKNKSIETTEKNRQYKKIINNNIKKLLWLNDDVFFAKNWEYKLIPSIKQYRERVTSDDVLWHNWRYIQYNEEYIDNYYWNQTNTINRN